MATTISNSFLPSKLQYFHRSCSNPPRNLRILSCLSLDQSKNVSSTTTTTMTLRVIFAAGGTGGHIYPAVAIADELKALNQFTQILFIGTKTGMESTAIPSAGYPFTAITASPLSRPIISLKNLIIFPFILTSSLLKSLKIIQEMDPHVVVGTGGYVSLPICLAAALKGVKLVIQEQNSEPGIANWGLSLLAERVFVAYDSSVECFWQKEKCVVCGNPVRSAVRTFMSKVAALREFFPKLGDREGQRKVVLVLGGSLGANAINIELLHSYRQLLRERKDLCIIWQTGVESFDEMESLVRSHPRLLLAPFLHSLDFAYAAADLVVSRAGAMTCSEILATGKPCILIPSPDADEGHQLRNAGLMADLAGARVIMEDELDSTTLRTTIEEILGKMSAFIPSISLMET
ncbi:hypothetical protein Leryth_006107 [Lithospermum erythrorhizon]|nr:hypothetical protein Leryth_006107 [Lithospermum erythrorhizon]